jgi:hypothetical protein
MPHATGLVAAEVVVGCQTGIGDFNRTEVQHFQPKQGPLATFPDFWTYR